MNTSKVDVSINYYGKPYQTIVTLLTLWKHSQQHIDKIYLVVEKQQPYAQYGNIKILQWALRDLPIHYYFATHFYYAGSPPLEALTDAAKRYGLKYQYGLEQTEKAFHFLSHNDCLYQADLLGMMLKEVSESDETVAGVGMIGQCWNCPALAANVCDGFRFESFQPSPDEYERLLKRHLNDINIGSAREAIHFELIEKGRTYPQPECRLNEYACLVNAELYQKLTKPNGEILPLGASWHGTDWGTVWFYDMVNAGYKFIHYPFEPHMIHAPFTPAKSGHLSDFDSEEYFRTEENARQYLLKEFPEVAYAPPMIRLSAVIYQQSSVVRRLLGKVKGKLSRSA